MPSSAKLGGTELQDEILLFLETGNDDEMTTAQIAAHFNCGVTVVKRCKALHKAKELLKPEQDNGALSQMEMVLHDILRASNGLMVLRQAMDHLDDEKKMIKGLIRDAEMRLQMTHLAAEESHPLFDSIDIREAIQEVTPGAPEVEPAKPKLAMA